MTIDIPSTKRKIINLFASVDWEIWVLLAVPLGLLLVNREWIFTDPYLGFIDPWIYFGYFLDLPGYLHIFSDTYYATRLSWILPGFYLYQIFSPVVANYLLHLLAYYASTIPLYLLLKLTLSRRLGLTAAVLMGCYPPFLNAVGWDYPDGAGIAYFLLTMLMLTLAARLLKWKKYLCLSGFFYGALVYSNLYWLAFTPIPVIHFLFMNQRNRKHSIPLSAIFFILGILLVTIVLGIFNYTHNRNFLFFYPTIKYLMSIRFSQDASYYDSSYKWVWAPSFLHVIAAAAVISVSFVAVRITDWMLKRSGAKTIQGFQIEPKDDYVLMYQVYFLLCFVIMVLLELKGWPAFQYFYYASSIIPCMFIAVVACTRGIVEHLAFWKFIVLVVAAALLIPVIQFSFLFNFFTNPSLTPPLLIIAAFLLLGSFVLQILQRKQRIELGFLAILFSILAFTSFNVRIASHVFLASEIGSAQDGYVAVVNSVKAIRTRFTDGELRDIVRYGKRLFWYDSKARLGGLYTSITSSHLWLGLLINNEFPALHDMVLRQPVMKLLPDTKLILLADGDNVIERANKALKQINLHVQVFDQEHIQSGKVDFTMLFVKTVVNTPSLK